MKILEWWGVSGVLFNECATFTLTWKSLVPKRCRGKLWYLIMGCVIWSLWFERNKIKFENGSCDPENLVNTVKARVRVLAKELLGLELAPNHDFTYHPEAIQL